MRAKPLPVPKQHMASGVIISDSDDALHKDITLGDIMSCAIKRLKRGKWTVFSQTRSKTVENFKACETKLGMAVQLYAGWPIP